MSSALNALRRRATPGQFKDFLRWYLTPSGVVLAVALALLLVSLLEAGAPVYTVLPAIGILGAFFPYKFLREQRLQIDRAGEVELRLRSQLARLEEALDTRLNLHDETLRGVAIQTADAIRVHAEALGKLDRAVAELRPSTRSANADVA